MIISIMNRYLINVIVIVQKLNDFDQSQKT